MSEVKVVNESSEARERHAEEYRTPKKESVSTHTIRTSSGRTKEKIIQAKTYANGVVKNELIGLKKDGRLIFGRGK